MAKQSDKAKSESKAKKKPTTEIAETDSAPIQNTAPETVKPVKKKSAKSISPDAPAFPETEPIKAIKKNGKKKDLSEPQETGTISAPSPVKFTKKPAGKKKSSAAVPDTFHGQEVSVFNIQPVEHYTRFTDFDIHLFRGGKHYKLYEKFGSHVVQHNGITGTYFAVWAPNAKYVSVIGNFNGWNKGSHPLFVRWDHSGIWEGFIPNIGSGEVYKYFINSNTGEDLEKGDPYALSWEIPPSTASIVKDTWYEWNDDNWMETRRQHNSLHKPYSVYELHLGSWARSPESPDDFLNYRQLADKLVPYIKDMGFTHVEFMPVMEHPYYPSWGYQIIGYYAASSRYGSPQDLMYLVEQLHNAGIGVILDWVPSHFPGDAHGLYNFDGTHLYEHADARKGFHPDWKSYIFNYNRNEVRSFLISNAIFWLDRYHIDGLRVDAVASMLYLDYSRKHGEWEPNIFGGNENLEAISFLKEFNEAVYQLFPDTQTIAEESTSFKGVSKPVFMGGLGFGMKWMMGWMHDTIKYFHLNPIHRKYHHNQITFSLIYTFTENFMLPFSHDEVVYGKGSMLGKMPGDDWQRFANLRLLYSYMFTHPGTKLLFMGSEFGQSEEWNFQHSLDWHLLQYESHFGIQSTVKALNHLYRDEPALFDKQFDYSGFEWIDGGNAEDSILVYARKANDSANDVVVVLNMTPVVRYDYRVGVPAEGTWKEIFNSDRKEFWGSGFVNENEVQSEKENWHGRDNSIRINVPPLAATIFKRIR
ncbi:1,4-alpha-glucan branching protein GlgB [Mucilaginibacter sp. KACC 22063]|uniref:1,4-alpha-glucan branching protein GlgB n=1 Tax=Mucilaginibacter sp. KACC 22063 TaxID=3025666 RepID=UPI00236582AB|nr:1,4-alpha-glucan branching protein GlgB [Mucilaginibacter sp. KACC 22063]WDF56654.1 1,4-alpha-glucan branching protein GlgB [Mucilaginibacter sp. KACC 22063]